MEDVLDQVGRFPPGRWVLTMKHDKRIEFYMCKTSWLNSGYQAWGKIYAKHDPVTIGSQNQMSFKLSLVHKGFQSKD